MKANLNTLIQALKLTAEAHRAEIDITDEFIFISKDSVPVISDVRSIVESFTGSTDAVTSLYYSTVINLNELKFAEKFNELLLDMSLPYGWINKITED